jgi:hypothetical protein
MASDDEPPSASPQWVFGTIKSALAYAAAVLQERRNMVEALGASLGLPAAEVAAHVEQVQTDLTVLVFNTGPADFNRWVRGSGLHPLNPCCQASDSTPFFVCADVDVLPMHAPGLAPAVAGVARG